MYNCRFFYVEHANLSFLVLFVDARAFLKMQSVNRLCIKHLAVRGEGHGGPDREHDRPLPRPLRHRRHLPPEQVLHRSQA